MHKIIDTSHLVGLTNLRVLLRQVGEGLEGKLQRVRGASAAVAEKNRTKISRRQALVFKYVQGENTCY